MFKQKLKSFYSFLLPSRKTARTPSQSADLTPFADESDNKISARIVYTDKKNKQSVLENSVNAEHDWWIN